jgi:hypothetical protein
MCTEVIIRKCQSGAGGGSRTRVSSLGRTYNSRYKTPAFFCEPNQALAVWRAKGAIVRDFAKNFGNLFFKVLKQSWNEL